MALINCSECGKSFSDRASVCPHCGCPMEFAKQSQAKSIQSVNQQQAVSTPQALRKYLEDVRVLETDVYTMTTAINNLTAQIKPEPTKKSVYEPDKPYLREEKEAHGFWWWFSLNIFDWIGMYIWDIRKANKENKEIRAFNEASMARYHKEMVEYEAAVKAENRRYINAWVQTTAFNEGINKQIEALTTEKKATEAALQKVYDINIIYPKYRGIIPVTMFCEYMDSGLRTDLTGVNGMYQWYETQLMGQQIVNSLSEINSTLHHISYQLGSIANQLTEIQRNQTMLYEEIARGNEIASQINQSTGKLLEQSASMVSTMEDMERQIGSMRSTAETTAFTTAATARRVDAIAKIQEHEYALRHPNFPSV